jgi:hypothetical protein
MLPAEDLFVYVYALVDDAISSRAIAIAPGVHNGLPWRDLPG